MTNINEQSQFLDIENSFELKELLPVKKKQISKRGSLERLPSSRSKLDSRELSKRKTSLIPEHLPIMLSWSYNRGCKKSVARLVTENDLDLVHMWWIELRKLTNWFVRAINFKYNLDYVHVNKSLR